MKSKLEVTLRIILGLVLGLFGANKFLNFMPQPDPPAAGGAFLGALGSSGYVFPVIGVVFLIVAALLLVKKAVPFALILLAPIVVNIVLYHLKFDVAGFGAGAVIGILLSMLAFLHRDRFAPLFR